MTFAELEILLVSKHRAGEIKRFVYKTSNPKVKQKNKVLDDIEKWQLLRKINFFSEQPEEEQGKIGLRNSFSRKIFCSMI